MEILIRPYRLDDADAVHKAALESIADLAPWMPWAHSEYSIEESRAWLELQVPAFSRGTTFEFAIVTETDELLGGCGLNQFDRMNRRANLGYWVRSGAARRGVATTAVRTLRDWGFANTDLERIEIVMAVGNIASRRVAEKAGAVHEGILRSRLYLHGAANDAHIFSFTRADEAGRV